MSTHRPLPISPDHQDEVIEELVRIRDETVSTRHVAIKTENLIKNLNAEFKQVTLKQAHQERRSLFNSAVAYVLFVILIFCGLYLNFIAKVETYEAKLEGRERDINALERQLSSFKNDLGRWEQVERELLEFERLVREDNKEEAVRRFGSLRSLSFSGLLEELIVKFKGEVAREKYEQGVKSYEQKDFRKANELFADSIKYEATPPYLGDLLYYQGMCAYTLKDYDRATDLLTKAKTFKHDRKIRINIDSYLARAYDYKGDKSEARRHYYRFYIRYRNTEKKRAEKAKKRYEKLKKSR